MSESQPAHDQVPNAPDEVRDDRGPATSPMDDLDAARLPTSGGLGNPPSPSPSTAQPAPPRGLLRWLLQLPAYLFKARLGVLMGHRFLMLVHTGRRSGMRRETVLEVARYDRSRREAIVAAGWGRKTQWLHNVEAGLAREILIGRERFVPAYRVLELEEAQAVFEAYERHSGLPVGLVRSVLSRLLGWRYDGSRDARLRAARQLPLIGFRPAEHSPSDMRPNEHSPSDMRPNEHSPSEPPPTGVTGAPTT